MPIIQNRTVLEVAKNLTVFLSLDVGFTRGPVPDYDSMLKQAREETQQAQKQVSEKSKQLTQLQDQLTQFQNQLTHQLTQFQNQLSQRDQQLTQSRERLARVNQQLLDRDRQVAALQSSVDSAKGELYDEELYSDIEEMLDRIPIDLGGGCSVSKAYLFAWLIRRYDLKRTVDIGVYRGRSLFPQALAHSRFTGGVVYGVDPYSASEAREEDLYETHDKDKEAINRFVEQTDWEALCQEVASMRDDLGYADHCVLLRKTSADAAAFFEENDISFDMVHVDGNHDTEKVMEDVALYLPRLQENGFMVLDDLSFESVRPAYDELNARTTLVYERTDQDNANDFAVFRNVPPPSDARYDRRVWVRNFW